MPKRYFNWKLALVIVLGLVVVSTTAIVLKKWRKANSAETALTLGNQAYEEPNWPDAAMYLGRYLSVVQDDVEILEKYAEAQLNIRPLREDVIQQVISSYRIILRVDPSNLDIARRLVEIYLTVGMSDEAELIAGRQLEITPDAGLQRLYAVALSQQRKISEAAVQLKDICNQHPDEILAYEVMGKLIEQNSGIFTEQPVYWFNLAVEENPASALAYLIRASFNLRQSDKTGAVRDINRATNQDLSSTSVRLRLILEMLNADMLDRVQEQLDVLLEEEPDNQTLWQIWAQFATKSGSKERMSEIAAKGLENLSSQPWDFMPIAAELYIYAEQYDLAEQYISKLDAKDITPGRVSYLKGLIASYKDDITNALKYWRQAEQSGDTSAKLQLLIASALSNLGDTQSALGQLRELIASEPDSIDAQLAITRLYADTLNWIKVEEHAKKVIELESDNTEAYSLLLQARTQLYGTSYADVNEQSMASIEQQLAELERTAEPTINTELLRFQLRMQKGELADAEEIVRRLKTEYPSEVRVVLAEAELLNAQDQSDQAAAILMEAVEKFPQAPGPVRYLAFLLYRQQKQQECIDVLRDALARIDEPVTRREFGILLAQYYHQWSQIDDAYRLIEELSEEQSRDIPLKRALLSFSQISEDASRVQQLINEIKSVEGEQGWQWRYEQAKFWYNSEDFMSYYPQIVSYLQENLQLNVNDQTSRMLLANAYEKAGEEQLAISIYKEALNRSPDNAQIIGATVSALYRSGQFDQAEEIVNKISNQQSSSPLVKQLQLQNLLRQGNLTSASEVMQELLLEDPNNENIGLSFAILNMQQDKLDEAEEMLESLRQKLPESLAVAAIQVRLKLGQEKPEEAIAICDDIINRLNNSDAYLLRAQTYYSTGQYEMAEKDLGSAISIEPENINVWTTRSDFYGTLDQIDEAVGDIQHALSIAPDNLDVQKRAITLYLLTGQPQLIENSRQLLAAGLQSHPADAELKLFKARLLLVDNIANSVEEARKILQEINQDNPEVSDAWQLLGELSLTQNQPGPALDLAMRGLSYSPSNKQLMYLKARAEAARSPVLAVPTFRQLCEMFPDDVSIANELAKIYISTGESEKAISLLRQQKQNSNASVHQAYDIALAVALYNAGDKQLSKEQFATVFESAQGNITPLLAQLQLLLDDQQWEEIESSILDWYQKNPQAGSAVASLTPTLFSAGGSEAQKISSNILEAVLSNEPENVIALKNMAVLLQSQGQIEESVVYYRLSIEKDPNNVQSINNLAWILCENYEQYQEALELAERGIKLRPDYADLGDTLGVIYYRMQNYEQAVDELTRVLGMYSASSMQAAVVKFHLARALYGLDQKTQAKQYLQEALEYNNQSTIFSAEELAEAQLLMEN